MGKQQTGGKQPSSIMDKVVIPVITTAIIAGLGFIFGFFAIPGRMDRVEKQTEKIPEFAESVGSLKADLKNFKDTTDRADKLVTQFGDKIAELEKLAVKLGTNVDNLAKLTDEIPKLREAVNELRTAVAALPASLKQNIGGLQHDETEVSEVVFLTDQGLGREGAAFSFKMKYPERLAGHPPRAIHTRYVAGNPAVPGVSSITSIVEPQEAGYTLHLTTPAPEADALNQFLKQQPLPVEIVFLMDR